jgi:hypothetical protein
MKKIFLGLLAVLVAVSLVGGAAYAQWSASATVQGMLFSTGQAGLQVALPHQGGPMTLGYGFPPRDPCADVHWSDSVTVNQVDGWKDLVPGHHGKTRQLCIKNTSSDDVDLKLSAVLTHAGDDVSLWNLVKDVVKVSFKVDGKTPSGNFTLNQWWNDLNGQPVDNVVLESGHHYPVDVTITLDSAADNSLQNKTVPTDWKFVGVQQ